ncbi:MAG: hypothetical protein R3E89_09335 [Thiolinea sp.]
MADANKRTLMHPLSLALGAGLAAGSLLGSVAQADNPFAGTELSSGYLQLAGSHGGTKEGEGSCGGKSRKKAVVAAKARKTA